MKTLHDVIMGNAKEPSGQGWVLPSAQPGRFVLSPEFDIFDTANSNTRHVRDRSIPLEQVGFNISGLTAENTNVAYLYAHGIKPVVGLTVAQFQSKTALLVEYKDGAMAKDPLEPADFFWHVPDGGVEFATDKLLIPGFGEYYVDSAAWAIKHVADDSLVVPGTNRGNWVVLKDDHGEMAEVNQANIIRYAVGAATIDDFDATVYFKDHTPTNLNPTNLTIVKHVEDGSTESIADPNADFVIGNETV